MTSDHPGEHAERDQRPPEPLREIETLGHDDAPEGTGGAVRVGSGGPRRASRTGVGSMRSFALTPVLGTFTGVVDPWVTPSSSPPPGPPSARPAGARSSTSTPSTSAKFAVEEALKRSGIPVEDVDDIVLGEVLQGGGDIARYVAVELGMLEVPGLAHNRHCASSLAVGAVGRGQHPRRHGPGGDRGRHREPHASRRRCSRS